MGTYTTDTDIQIADIIKKLNVPGNYTFSRAEDKVTKGLTGILGYAGAQMIFSPLAV